MQRRASAGALRRQLGALVPVADKGRRSRWVRDCWTCGFPSGLYLIRPSLGAGMRYHSSSRLPQRSRTGGTTSERALASRRAHPSSTVSSPRNAGGRWNNPRWQLRAADDRVCTRPRRMQASTTESTLCGRSRWTGRTPTCTYCGARVEALERPRGCALGRGAQLAWFVPVCCAWGRARHAVVGLWPRRGWRCAGAGSDAVRWQGRRPRARAVGDCARPGRAVVGARCTVLWQAGRGAATHMAGASERDSLKSQHFFGHALEHEGRPVCGLVRRARLAV